MDTGSSQNLPTYIKYNKLNFSVNVFAKHFFLSDIRNTVQDNASIGNKK